MKILHVISSVTSKAGGTTEALVRIAESMTDLDIEVEIASLDAPDTPLEAFPSLPCSAYKIGPTKLGTYGLSASAKQWLNVHVLDYDAVIIHGLWQYHLFAASRACRKHRVPYFVFSHGMLDPWFNETYPLKKLKKQLYWFWGEHPALEHANTMLFTCEAERLLARESFRPYRVKETVVGLGTLPPEASKAQLASELSASNLPWAQRPFFLFIGRIQEKKGLDLLVRSYQQLKQDQVDMPDLVIAGPVQQLDYAARLQTSQPQTGIHWVGSIQGEQKWQVMANAEAMILPSHQENFGIVVAEALAVGTPVLISNKVNIWREVEQGHAGYVRNDTHEGTVELLKSWLALDTESKKQMSLAACEVFRTHFDIRESTKRLVDCIYRYIN